MDVLFISKSKGSAARLPISIPLVLALIFLGVGGVSGLWFLGFQHGSAATLTDLSANPERAVAIWQREIGDQRRFLSGLKRDLDAELGALAATVGGMQGEILRLNAVAEHVIVGSGLDPSEFGLAGSSPIGGPREPDTLSPQWPALLTELSNLKDEIALRKGRLDILEAFLVERNRYEDSRPIGRPVDSGWISSGYGYRADPVTGEREFHGGIDFAGKPGAKVRAVAPGIVTWSGKRWGYGNLVEINHGNGFVTRYAHNKENLVRLGEKVAKQQEVALLGSSGRSTGPHVHFEILHEDRTVNPASMISINDK